MCSINISKVFPIDDKGSELKLQLIIRKTKVMTTRESHNFNVDNEESEIFQGFLFLNSVINLKGDCNQEIRRLKLRSAARKKFGKIFKCKNMRHWLPSSR